MELTSLELTAATAVVSTGLAAFAAFCPPMSKVVGDNGSGTMGSALNFGQNTAALATVSVGTVLSFVTHSPMPLVMAIGLAFLATFAYQTAFRKVA